MSSMTLMNKVTNFCQPPRDDRLVPKNTENESCVYDFAKSMLQSVYKDIIASPDVNCCRSLLDDSIGNLLADA